MGAVQADDRYNGHISQGLPPHRCNAYIKTNALYTYSVSHTR